MMKRILFAAIAGAVGLAGTAAATGDPIDARQEIMKNIGAATQAAGRMARGDDEFHAATAMMAMRTINAGANGAAFLFPEGTDTGGDTRALPAIWENFDDFQEKMEATRSASAAVIEAEPATLDDFRPLFATVGQTCGACHEDYRRPED